MLLPLTGCRLIDRISDRPSLTRNYVTILVQVYGLPYINEYYQNTVGEEEAERFGRIEVISTTGTWQARYQGDGLWQIQGLVETTKWGDCLTTWTLRESEGRIRLIGFACD